MKKTILVSLLLFVVAISNVQAQDNAFKADAVKLVKLSSDAAEAALEQVYVMIPEEKLEGFKKELEPVMDRYYEKIAIKSMEYYTHEDVKQLLKFYNSELGKKNLKVQEEMAIAAMGPMAQELQRDLMPMLQKYMSGQ